MVFLVKLSQKEEDWLYENGGGILEMAESKFYLEVTYSAYNNPKAVYSVNLEQKVMAVNTNYDTMAGKLVIENLMTKTPD